MTQLIRFARATPLAIDLALAIVAAVLLLADITADPLPAGARAPDAFMAVGGGLMVAALALRRRAPLPTLGVAAGAWLTLSLLEYPPLIPFAPLAMVFFLAGDGVPRRVGGAAAACLGVALMAPVGIVASPPRSEAELHVAYVLLVAILWLAGDRVRSGREHAASNQRAARSDERARLARELHDSVGHAMNTIGINAGAARLNLERDPAVAAEAVAAIERTAREAAAEMDALLGELGAEAMPGISDVATMIAARQTAGQSIEADISPVGEVPAEAGRAIYRIIQESLTNAERHAPGSPVTVSLRRADDELRLEVANAAPSATIDAGRGIAGMRARARALGGDLFAAQIAGRVVVEARLPTEVEE